MIVLQILSDAILAVHKIRVNSCGLVGYKVEPKSTDLFRLNPCV